MKRTIYLECFSGISGDMFTAALLDLGADREGLMKVLSSLPIKGFETAISYRERSGIRACDFAVLLDKEHENHDHDMAYLHGTVPDGEECAKHHHDHEHHHEHQHDHAHHHAHDHEHDHEHEHHHDHGHHHDHEHHHEHRSLGDVLTVLRGSDLPPRALAIAEKIFRIVAEAESEAHGLPVDKVHFHEVGAVDSIVDIAAAAYCLDNLDVGEVIIPVLYEGEGTVRCQHGILPVPVPAVVNILKKAPLKVHKSGVFGELITPTGAAIAAAIQSSSSLPEEFKILRVGIGAGKRDYACPGILRAFEIEPDDRPAKERLFTLQTNVDDCTGEALGYLMERLLAAGARDAAYIPVFMKKNRPGWLISVICDGEHREALKEVLFAETTTIGVRSFPVERTVLDRHSETRKTSLGPVRVKTVCLSGESRTSPEYEDVARICREKGLGFQKVLSILAREM